MYQILSKIKSKLILWLVVALSCLVLTPAAFAGNSINTLSQQVVIDKDSVATITETIDYNFETERHGIDRYYELVSKTTSGKYYQLNFQLLGVLQDGSTVKANEGRLDNQYRLRIGDSNTTISGMHRYQISYKMWPVVREDPAGDYINYDVTGNGWQVPVLKATATITLPDGVAASQTRCYTGSSGSTSQDCSISASSNTVTLSNLNTLNAKEGMTANILTPTGSFSTYLKATDKPSQGNASYGMLLSIFSILLGIVIVVVGCIIRLFKWINKRRAQKAETVVAQYSLPDNIAPAEAGILEDNKSNMREITATVIDLAVRGFLKIKKVESDYEFELLKKPDSSLLQYEATLYSIFTSSADTKTNKFMLASVDGKVSSEIIKTTKSQIVDGLLQKGLYQKGRASKLAHSSSIFGVIFFQFMIFFWAYQLGFITLPFACVYLAYQIARTSDLTSKGYDAWAFVKGLKLYLTVAEKDRINFHEAPKRTPKHFSTLLPAAIALGVEKEWAKQFKDLDMAKSLSWYDSDSAFNTLVLVNVLGTDLNSSLTSSFAAPSSSSFGSSSGDFGGGGFSGGGDFGGGGGGDW